MPPVHFCNALRTSSELQWEQLWKADQRDLVLQHWDPSVQWRSTVQCMTLISRCLPIWTWPNTNLSFQTISQLFNTYLRLCCPPSLGQALVWDFGITNGITSDRQLATLLGGFLYTQIYAGMGLKVGLKNLFWRLLCAIGFHKKPSAGYEGYSNSSRQPDMVFLWSEASPPGLKGSYMLQSSLQTD